MKNITVSVPDDVYYAARVRAAEMRTTVSALVREQLVALSKAQQPALPPTQDPPQQAEDFEQEHRDLLAALDRIREERSGGTPFSSVGNLTREQLYDPDLRRLERAHLQRNRTSKGGR